MSQQAANPKIQKVQSELEAIDRELAEIHARQDKALGNDQANFDELRIRNARRSDERLANFRKTAIGQVVERLIFNDEGSTRERIQADHDTASVGQLKKIVGSLEQGDYTSDPQIKKALQNLTVSSMLYQYYSANYHDDAQDRMVLDMPYWSLAYQFGGAFGTALAIRTSLNQSMASEATFLQLGKMRTEMTVEYLRILNTTNIFAMNKNQGWLENEQMRGASSVDPVIGRARIEFQNMEAPPYKEYGQAQNLRMKFEPEFRGTQERYYNEQRRLSSDLFFNFSGL